MSEVASEVRTPYRNLWIFLALTIPAALFGFGKSYFKGYTFSGAPVTMIVHVHAALMASWLLMLTGQAWFIRANRYTLHRWVGRRDAEFSGEVKQRISTRLNTGAGCFCQRPRHSN